MSKLVKADFRVVKSIIKSGQTRKPGYEFHACVDGVHVQRWLEQGRIIKLPAVDAIEIRVRATGSDNYATVPGHKIKASCTSAPMFAATRAAEKFFGERKFNLTCSQVGSCARGELYLYVAKATDAKEAA